MAPVNTDFSIPKKLASDLMGVSLLPDEFRRAFLEKLQKEHGAAFLVEAFSAFIGLSNSVVANTREFVEEYLFVECDHAPSEAEKINLPTIQGALAGIEIAIKPVRGMCSGCAFRLATPANQSPSTTCDAKWSTETDDKFMCHMKLDAKGNLNKLCAGYARSHMQNFTIAVEEKAT